MDDPPRLWSDSLLVCIVFLEVFFCSDCFQFVADPTLVSSMLII